jgi:hypothetical protein
VGQQLAQTQEDPGAYIQRHFINYCTEMLKKRLNVGWKNSPHLTLIQKGGEKLENVKKGI